MLDMNNLRKEKHEDLCKILDYVLVALFAVFFILSLFPYFSVEDGGVIEAKGYTAEAKGDDSWSLLGYAGFPYNHEDSVAEWQEEQYKVNKATIKENEENGYKGFFKTTLAKMGVQQKNKKGEKNPYQDLEIPGITTKTVSIKQVGGILFLVIFALVNIAWLLLKKGSSPKAVMCTLWAVLGILIFRGNYLINMGTNATRTIMLVVIIAVLAVGLVNSVFYIIDGRSRAAYLRSVSAAYA